MATAALLAAHAGEELLKDLASGEHTAVLVVPFATCPGAWSSVSVSVADGLLSGRVTDVADAVCADVLLVLAGTGLWQVEASAAQVRPVSSLDMTRQLCDVELSAVQGRQVGSGGAAMAAGLLVGAALLASEQLGLAERCLELTVDHVKTRYQFGRPVGSYQGLKHRLADLWVAITQARAVARYAAACVADGDPDAQIAVAVAQAHCGGVAVKAAEECVQMHGGIGFTWEHPAHLYLKRAKSTAIALGTADRHRARLAALVDLPA
jgi:alkylation response protein AidB-like acyl-CoA dehydrogenase